MLNLIFLQDIPDVELAIGSYRGYFNFRMQEEVINLVNLSEHLFQFFPAVFSRAG